MATIEKPFVLVSLEQIVGDHRAFFVDLSKELNIALRDVNKKAQAFGSHSKNIYPQLRREALDAKFHRIALEYGLNCEAKELAENGYVYTELSLGHVTITQHFSQKRNALPMSSHFKDSGAPIPQLSLDLYPAPLTMSSAPDSAIISYGVNSHFASQLSWLCLGRVNRQYGSWLEQTIDLLELSRDENQSKGVSQPALTKSALQIGLKSGK